jgi:uncharacterized protein (DUF2141 family)
LEPRCVPTLNLINSYQGLTFNDDPRFEPPDTDMAAGPNHLVETVNASIAIYSKADGTRLSSQTLENFFAPLNPHANNLFDPVVTWDNLANRFIVAVLETDTNTYSFIDLAVSNSADPTKGFTEMHQINIQESSGGNFLWGDYPKVGYNADDLVFSVNMYPSVGSFDHVQVVAIDKSTILDASNSTFTKFQDDISFSAFTLAGATQHDAKAGDPQYFVQEKGDNQTIQVVKATNLLSTSPTFQTFDVSVPAYAFGVPAQDPGGQTDQLIDTRILNASMAGGHLVASHIVGAGGVDQARWYDFTIGTGSPSLNQSGNINQGANVFTYYPAIDVNAQGAMGMSFMESSSTEQVSMYVTGRSASDPAGTMATPVLVKAGEANYIGQRGGDFSGISIDPGDGSFWAANEYAITGNFDNWGTFFAHFTADNFTTINGEVFQDSNGNGKLDAGEPGLSGWTVNLEDTSNNILATQTTDSNGNFAFNQLPPGSYQLVEVSKKGWTQTSPNPIPITISAGQTVTGNFGNFRAVRVSGMTRIDTTGDGLTSDDQAVGGLTVTLFQDTNGDGVLDKGDKQLGQVVTPASGNNIGLYVFSTLGPGTYFVQETVPTGYTLTTPPNPGYYSVQVVSGRNNDHKDFDNFQPSTVGGTVFNDKTGDGLTSDDTPLAGVTVALIQDTNGDGVLDQGDTQIASTTSAPDGTYSFTQVAGGKFFVQEALPPGYVLTAPAAAGYNTVTVTGSGQVFRGQNFDNFLGGAISGTTRTDLTGDGLTSDDTPLGGVTVTLFQDTNGDGKFDSGDTQIGQVVTPTSGNVGAYSFSALPLGTYFVQETAPAGNALTAPVGSGYYTFAVTTAGATAGNRDFDNFQGFAITGSTLSDTTGNGLSGDDTPLGGVTVALFQDTNGNGVLDGGDTQVATTTTASSGLGLGTYVFALGTPGTYFVQETAPPASVQTGPAAPGYYSITAAAGNTYSNRDFDNFQLATLNGTTRTDLTGNGLSADDTAVGGVTVTLFQDTNGNGKLDAGDTQVAQVVTPTSGNVGTYSFGNLGPGTYFVQQTPPAGYVATAPATYYAVAPTSGSTATDDFDDFRVITVSGTTRNDLTGNGLTSDDTPLGGATVTLFQDTNGDGVLDQGDTQIGQVVTPTSGSVGAYSFANVGPGTYFLQETPPSGYTVSGPAAPGYYTINPASGVDLGQQDFDNFQLATVSGTVFTDKTGNGLSGDDTPLGGVNLTLFQDTNGDGVLDQGDTQVGTAVSSSTGGTFSFTGVGPGTLFVQETVPAGYTLTAPSGPAYRTVQINSSGQTVTQVNFDNFQAITISGTTRTDKTGNGLSPDDTPLGGVTVSLFQDTDGNGILDGGDTQVGQVTTPTSGNVGAYSFGGLLPGTYFVQETAPAGDVPTAPASPGDYTDTATTSGTAVTGEDFDNFQLAGISGTTRIDLNGDGLIAGDPALGGVTVTLYQDTNGNGVLDAADTQIGQVVTPTSGNVGAYSFSNLGPGIYFVQETVPAGYFPTLPQSGYYTVNPLSGTTSAGVDFGNFKAFSMSGLAFTDLTGNGLTGDDTPLGGQTVNLFRDANNNAVLDAGDGAPVASQTTANDGTYSFSNLGPGTYFVQEAVPAGFALTVPGSPGYYSIHGTSGNNLSAVNFGNFRTITVSGRVFNDLNADGQADPGDPGLNGVPVVLYRDVRGNGLFDPTVDPAAASTTTTTIGGQDGEYLLSGVGPGQYIVRVPQQAARIVSSPPPGSYSFTVQAGVNQTGDDFGVILSVTQGFVYRVYVDLLGRAPDASEISNWSAIMNMGVPRSTIVADVQSSAEYEARLINNMFLSYLGRQASAAETANLMRVLNSTSIFVNDGSKVQQLRAVILGSPEYFQRAGGTTAGFLAALFRDTLGRTITAGEVANLSAALNGGLAPTTLIRAILSSPEGEAFLVQGFYQRFLHRSAGAGEVAGWVSALNSGLPEQQLVALLMGSDEFLNPF